MTRAPQRGSPQQEAAIKRILTAAITHISAGRLDEAARTLEASGGVALKTPTAQNILGDIQLKRGRPRDALRAFDAALRMVPSFPEAHCNRAVALQEMGRHQDALTALDRALSYRAAYPMALYNRGNVLEKLSRPGEAVAAYDKALKLQPAFPEARLNRGLALLADDKPLEAIADFRRALALRPKMVAAEIARAGAHRRLGQRKEALAAAQAALTIDPDSVEAALLKVNLLIDMDSNQDALAEADQLISRAPELAKAHAARANALNRLKRFDEALAAADEAVRLAPRDPDGHTMRGVVFGDTGRLEEQLEALNAARTFGAGGHAFLHSRAVALTELGDLDEALALFHEALKHDPANALTHQNLGMLQLFLGDFAQGWAEHEWRLRAPGYARRELLALAPQWQGEALDGKRLLLFSEQGLGDSIQFLRFVPEVQAKGAGITLVLQPALQGIARRSLPGVDVAESIGMRRGFDYRCSLMSLPHVLGTTLETIPRAVPYLAVDPELVAKWRERLGADGFKVGIVWQGNPDYPRDRYRSIPLRRFAPLGAVPGVRLISLQAFNGLDQLDHLPEGMAVETLGDAIARPDGFDDLAGTMANLDLVVASDTSAAHFAGALARPVWVALRYRPDWRWLKEGETSPWYPTMRLFRQQTHGDWDGVFAAIAAELGKASRGNA